MKIPPPLLLAAANLLWAGNWIVGRGVRADVPPATLSFWRWLIALTCIAVLAAPHLRRDHRMLLAHWRPLALSGLLGVAIYNTFTYVGLQYTEAVNGLLLNSFIPVVIVAMAWLFQGRPMGARELSGVALSFVGVMIIVARGDVANLLRIEFNRGDLWILSAVFAWAAYTLLLPRRPQVHPLSFLFAIAAWGALAILPFYLLELYEGRRIIASAQAWLAIAYTGVFPAFLGFVCWNRGVEAIGAARAGLYIHLLPVFGVLLAALFLGESVLYFHYAGFALIFGGIWLATQRR